MRLFLRQFFAELLKMFARKRTWIGFVAFVALELLVLMLSQTDKAKRGFRISSKATARCSTNISAGSRWRSI